jgi:hypothetical protein
MSIGPSGIIGSVAGTPLSQAKGTDNDRLAQETNDQSRVSQSNQQAEKAAGIGETEEDAETGDRDADGRRLWEVIDAPVDETGELPANRESPRSKDPTGATGNQIDLSG